MKRYLLFLLIFSSITVISCTKREAEIKIKAEIVTESGDVKMVVRQEFLITAADLIALWNSIKEEAKNEIEFQKKINNLDNELNKNKENLSVVSDENSPFLKKIGNEIIEIVDLSIDKLPIIDMSYERKEIKQYLFIIYRKLNEDKMNFEAFSSFFSSIYLTYTFDDEKYWKEEIIKLVGIRK